MFASLKGTSELGPYFGLYYCYITMLLLVASFLIQWIGPNAKGKHATQLRSPRGDQSQPHNWSLL